jgi:ATP-dependent RNA helicase RhlE
MPAEIEDLARSLLRNPERIAIDPETLTVELITQRLYHVEKGDKKDLLNRLMTELQVSRAIVFSKTKHGADRIAKGLATAGITAGVIHANKGQGNRTRTMEAFRSGETRVLVATDIAARGIDVDDISHVFNYDMPTEPETYVHRIGRTARAGAAGTAISFCDTEELKLLKQIERLLKKPIPVAEGKKQGSTVSDEKKQGPSASINQGPPKNNRGRGHQMTSKRGTVSRQFSS